MKNSDPTDADLIAEARISVDGTRGGRERWRLSGGAESGGGVNATARSACVLLSGGMDSAAALRWAKWQQYENLRTITFDYGQPHRDAEVTMAGRIARRNGVENTLLAMADTLRTGAGLVGRVEDHAERRGHNAAFVPGRNLVFLAVAASHAVVWFPKAWCIDLVVGCCREDTDGFPDCQEHVLTNFGSTSLSWGTGREINVAAPYVRVAKADIVRDVAKRWPSALRDVTESWSCYRGAAEPCGTCTACVMRERAFSEAGVDDQAAAPKMFGGDDTAMKMGG